MKNGAKKDLHVFYKTVTTVYEEDPTIGPLHDPVTWYGINYTGTQMAQWDFQNKGTRASPARLSFVLEVPLRHLRPSVIYSVPCDRIVQRAYFEAEVPQVISVFRKPREHYSWSALSYQTYLQLQLLQSQPQNYQGNTLYIYHLPIP